MAPVVLSLAVALARLAGVPGCVVFGVVVPGDELVVSPRVALRRLAGSGLFSAPLVVSVGPGGAGSAVFAGSGLPAFSFGVVSGPAV